MGLKNDPFCPFHHLLLEKFPSEKNKKPKIFTFSPGVSSLRGKWSWSLHETVTCSLLWAPYSSTHNYWEVLAIWGRSQVICVGTERLIRNVWLTDSARNSTHGVAIARERQHEVTGSTRKVAGRFHTCFDLKGPTAFLHVHVCSRQEEPFHRECRDLNTLYVLVFMNH